MLSNGYVESVEREGGRFIQNMLCPLVFSLSQSNCASSPWPIGLIVEDHVTDRMLFFCFCLLTSILSANNLSIALIICTGSRLLFFSRLESDRRTRSVHTGVAQGFPQALITGLRCWCLPRLGHNAHCA